MRARRSATSKSRGNTTSTTTNRTRRVAAKKTGSAGTKRKKKTTTRTTSVRQVKPATTSNESKPAKVANSDGAIGENPRLDRRIIEGMLHNRQALLSELASEGITGNAVLRRAADLGLSDAFIRQVQGVAADLAGERPGCKRTPHSLGARTCLSCERVFLSSGPGNRLCMRCRGGDAGLAQL